jgi:hypothetical protein
MKSFLVTSTQKGLGPIICSAPNHRSESKITADNRRHHQLIGQVPIYAVTVEVGPGTHVSDFATYREVRQCKPGRNAIGLQLQVGPSTQVTGFPTLLANHDAREGLTHSPRAN